MRIEIHPQKVYASIIAYMLSFLGLLTLFNSATNELGWNTSLDTYLFIAVLLSMFLFGFFALLLEGTGPRIDCWIIIVFFAFFYLLSWICFPQNGKYLFTTSTDFFGNPIYSLFVLSLPGYIFARHLKDYTRFCSIMRRYAYVVVGLSIIVFFFMKNSFATQYLSFSYNMLLHLLFLLFYKPQKGRFVHYIVVILGVFVFVVGGARGALLSFAICCATYMIATKRQAIRNLVLMIIASVGTCLVLIMKNEILMGLLPLLAKMKIESRTIQMMFSSELMDSSGRDSIVEVVLDNLSIFGRGMMGDRVICSGLYAHNLFLELLCDLGVILGSVISFIILSVVIAGAFKKIKRNQTWIILLLSTGFLKLMLSGSVLNMEPAFYVLMGLCVNSFAENKVDDKTIQKNIYPN